MKLIRASNTDRVLGFRAGPLSVVNGSLGTYDHYRNGYIVYIGRRVVGFIPTTGYRSIEL